MVISLGSLEALPPATTLASFLPFFAHIFSFFDLIAPFVLLLSSSVCEMSITTGANCFALRGRQAQSKNNIKSLYNLFSAISKTKFYKK